MPKFTSAELVCLGAAHLTSQFSSLRSATTAVRGSSDKLDCAFKTPKAADLTRTWLIKRLRLNFEHHSSSR